MKKKWEYIFQYYVLTRLFVIWEKRNNLARPVLLSLYMNAYPNKYKYLLLTREEQQGEAGILQSNFTVEKQQIPVGTACAHQFLKKVKFVHN